MKLQRLGEACSVMTVKSSKEGEWCYSSLHTPTLDLALASCFPANFQQQKKKYCGCDVTTITWYSRKQFDSTTDPSLYATSGTASYQCRK